MIIDAHNHADWHKHNFEKFIANMDKYNIDKTWILTWLSPVDEYGPHNNAVCNPEHDKEGGPIPFARCLSYVERCPERFILGYAPDPRLPDAIDKLNTAIDLYGVKVYGELKLRMMYDNFDAIRMFRFCGEKGLPVTVHLDYEFDHGVTYPRPNYWYGGGIEAFERAVAQCPETNFLGHAPGFWAHISKGYTPEKDGPYPTGKVTPGGKVEEMLEKYPNLYCDMSAGSGCNAFSRDPEFAKKFLITWQDRILYARDYFDNIHQEFLNSLDLPKEVLDKIYYKNALKLIHEEE